ncbi:CBM35 domain-containing protein, partial [Klebsiella michiganensis]
TLTTSQDQGVQLSASWRDDALPDRNVTVSWSNGGSAQAHFCATDKAETRAWFSAPGEYALTFSADDGLL